MKSLLIEDTTVDERMQIVKEALGGFGNCDCEGIDMDDMYDDYIFGRRELADINREFSQQHAGAVKAEDRDSQLRVDEVGRLDHVVLLVALDPVLGSEGGAQPEVGQRGQRVEAVRQVGGDRGGMREQRDALSLQRGAKRGVGEQAVDAEGNSHAASGAPSVSAKQSG